MAEAATIVATAIAVAAAPGIWQIAAAAWWSAGAVVLASTDITVRRLPYRVTAAMTAGWVALQAMSGDTASVARAAIAAAAAATVFAIAAHLARGQLGWGDVALAIPAAAFGTAHSLTATVMGLLTGFAAASAYIAFRRIARRPAATVPLGPFLLAGMLAGIQM